MIKVDINLKTDEDPRTCSGNLNIELGGLVNDVIEELLTLNCKVLYEIADHDSTVFIKAVNKFAADLSSASVISAYLASTVIHLEEEE